MTSVLQQYLERVDVSRLDPGAVAYVAGLDRVQQVSPPAARSIVQELADQRAHVKLIASENYSSLATQAAMGSLLTDKYAEGFPHHRFYAGCQNVDDIEAHACEQARKLFGCDHAYVQPHSGADANMIAFWAILNTRVRNPALDKLGAKNPASLTQVQWNELRLELNKQRLMAMDYYAGGHLTHGYRFNVSGVMFEVHNYGVNLDSGLIDYEEIEKTAREFKPLILLAGYSAYPREISFRRMREIADAVGAVLMVDMAHFAGLVAGGVFKGDFSPFPHAHVVTTTTHKTLRGPRGGMVLCTEEFAAEVDKGCPTVIGGPLPHVMAAKAVAFTEALTPEFKDYAARIVENSRALAAACREEGLEVVTEGTDNHIVLVDVRPLDLTGRQAEAALRDCHLTLNRNSLPNDPNGPWYTSGLRLGTPAITTLGMGPAEMKEVAAILALVLKNTRAEAGSDGKPSKAKYAISADASAEAIRRVTDLLGRFPLYPELDLEFLKTHFAAD